MKYNSKSETMYMLNKNNCKLARILKDLNIKKINLINCGNSISAGYSMSSFTKPLLLRNENIKKLLNYRGIEIKRYNFSRAEDNNDEHIFSWLVNDIPLSDISKLNMYDIKAMKMKGITDDNINEYYPKDEDTTIKKLLNEDTNIIIYNGATGSFLDNVTRGGKHYFTHGIKRDCTSIESFLKYIQEMNREQGKDIQVYLCGAPKLFGATDIFINPRLKKISEEYANVTYVPNINKKAFYKNENNKAMFDLHYDEYEYLNLNNKIIETIDNNYLLKKILIEIDREMYLLNKNYQMKDFNRDSLKDIFYLAIIHIINKYLECLNKENLKVEEVLEQVKKYLLERAPYDFYYIGKENIKALK